MTCCNWRCSGLIAITGAAMIGMTAFAQPEKKPAGLEKPAQKTNQPKEAAKPAPQDANQQAMMEAWMKASTPGEYHRHLDAFAGEWDCKLKMQEAPGAPMQESSGSMKNEWILGGRQLQQSYKGDFMGMDFEGRGTWGYDNVSKKYQGTWTDTTVTSIMTTEGTCDASGKVFTMTGEFSDPMGGKVKQRQVITVKDDNTHTMDFYMTGPDGKEFKSMEMTYTRKAGTSRPAPAVKPVQVKPAGK